MGVMCSLLGHDYGETDVERERTERGDEIVLTATRIERCQNCGHERTISENTEVTALSATAGIVRDADGTVVVPNEDLDGADVTGEVEADDADRPPEATTEERTVDADPDPEPEPASESAAADGGPADTADGRVVVEATETTPVDGHDPTDPEPSGPDDRGGATPSDVDREKGTDGVGIDRVTDSGPARRERRRRPRRAPGEWPAEPGDSGAAVGATATESGGLDAAGSLVGRAQADGDWPGESATGSDSGQEAETAGTGERSANVTRPRAGDSFGCAACGFSATVADSPLRAGDICPDCHRGYLAWETRKG